MGKDNVLREWKEFQLLIKLEAYRPSVGKDGSKTYIMGFSVEGMLQQFPRMIYEQAKKKSLDEALREIQFLLEQYSTFKIASLLGIKNLPINLEDFEKEALK